MLFLRGLEGYSYVSSGIAHIMRISLSFLSSVNKGRDDYRGGRGGYRGDRYDERRDRGGRRDDRGGGYRGDRDRDYRRRSRSRSRSPGYRRRSPPRYSRRSRSRSPGYRGRDYDDRRTSDRGGSRDYDRGYERSERGYGDGR